MANKLCTGRLREDKEDVVQESCMRVFRWVERESVDPRELTAAWLRTVVRNVVKDVLRKKWRERDLVEGEDRDFPSPYPDDERVEASRRLGEAMLECLDEIRSDRRRAVRWWIEGHARAEIAELFAWKHLDSRSGYKKAENLVQRGRVDLRACLAGKGYGKGYRL